MMYQPSVLRVLMYHKISGGDEERDALTVSVNQLEKQFNHLLVEGYQPIFLSELIAHIENGDPLPYNPVLISFDDGYKDNLLNMLPLAASMNIKTNIFLVPEYLRSNDEKYMSIADVLNINENLVEFGLHSYNHDSYNKLSEPEVAADLQHCFNWFNEKNIRVQPCLAYPYGSFPKADNERRHSFFYCLEQQGIKAAFRIGNRLNALPVENRFMIQRIDIRGSHSLTDFAVKLKYGKMTPIEKLVKKFKVNPVEASADFYRSMTATLKESVQKSTVMLS